MARRVLLRSTTMHQDRTTIAAFLFGTLVAASSARAQPAPTPPTIATFVEAEYPQAAREAGREASVELEITIGVDGLVTDARVVSPVGDGFDEAALAAVRRVVFTPATKDGAPVAARVRYRYVFELDVPAAPAEEVSATGRIEGRILSRGDGGPLIGVEVIATGADATEHRVTTDGTGGFT